MGKLRGIGVVGGSRLPIENVRRYAQAVEEAGASAIWWSDHLMGWSPNALWPAGNVRQPTPHGFLDSFSVIADVARSTEHVRLGIGVTDIFRRAPAVLAQTALTLGHLSEGRFVLGVGMGEAENLLPYGIPYHPSASRMAEFVATTRRLMLERGPLTSAGPHYPLHGAALDLELPANGPPPIWLAGSGPRGVRNVARQADGWLPIRQPLDVFHKRVEMIDAEARAVGRSIDEITTGMVCWALFARDHETAHMLLKSPLVKLFGLFAGPDQFAAHGARLPWDRLPVEKYIPTMLSGSEAIELADAIPDSLVHEHVAHGTAEDVLETLVPYRSRGLDHPVVCNITYFGDHDSIKESFRQQRTLLEIGTMEFNAAVPTLPAGSGS